MIWNFLFRVFRFCASLELAVTLILLIAVVLSVGTVYESKYSAAVAGQLVYRSWWMQAILWLFIINLTAAAFSRWPWKRHHIGFLITHLGIITLLFGSWITQRGGVDGILALGMGEKSRFVRLDENMLTVYRTLPGKTYDLILSQELNFDLRAPSESPKSFPLKGESPEKEIRVLKYYPKSTREVRAEDVKVGGVPGLKFQLSGSRATFDDWLFLQQDTGTTREIGPAIVKFIAGKPDLKVIPERATLILYLENNPKLPPKVAVATKGQKFRELGRAEVGKSLALGWMDFSFLLSEYHAAAMPKAEYRPYFGNSPMFDGMQAIEVEIGKDRIWLELGASGQVGEGDSLYYIQFNKRQIDLGFEVLLKKFQVGYYEGTTRPKSYSSEVEVFDATHPISMNEPMHQKGYTFYQASYEMDEEGNPRVSVLSVNYDPGRWVKYIGSLMIVFGVISMFYFKPQYSGTSKWLKKKEAV